MVESPPQLAAATAILPDGTTIEVLNSYEASFVINEIFIENAYPMDDIPALADPVIIDVGANIGIFAHYSLSRFPGARVFAFEPAPEVYAKLVKNTASFEGRVKTERCGVSDVAGEAEFTYYPNYSLLSGFKAELGEDEQLLHSGINSQLAANPRLAGRVTDRHVTAMASGKLDGAVTIRCPLQTLSHFITLNNLQRVDFLKVDAERCELPILRGISDAHWPLIQRVCMELHESSAAGDTTAQIQQILKAQGFDSTLKPSGDSWPRTILLHATRPA
jgi:FkbM family methyltransferase